VSIFAWYDIPVALAAGLCVVLAYQEFQRSTRNFFRRVDVVLARQARASEDFYWTYFRVHEAATAELFYVDRKIDSYVNGTAEIERPREAHSIRVSHLKEVI
jgi:hypothetical protein